MALQRGFVGGEKGIRTLGTLTGTPDFESGTFGRSVISPRRNMNADARTVNAVPRALVMSETEAIPRV